MRRLVVSGVILAVALPLAADRIDVPYENFPYNGRFTFVRVKFEPTWYGPGPYMWGLDLKWNHDYPVAERNLMMILDQFTTLNPNLGGGNIYGLDEDELFKYPWAYLCEVGFWNPTEEEVENLRTYLFKGGFLVVDDFVQDPRTGVEWQWDNFREQMTKLLPGLRSGPAGCHAPHLRLLLLYRDPGLRTSDVAGCLSELLRSIRGQRSIEAPDGHRELQPRCR